MMRHFLRALPMVLALLTITLLMVHSLVTDGAGLGSKPAVATDVPWASSLRTLDDALHHGSIDLAERAWHEAYSAALGSRQWEGMVAVGDAYLRIAAASGTGRAARARARQSYVTALYRARAAGSVDGVLRVAQAFKDLGDQDVVSVCLRIANDVAARSKNEGDRARVRRFAEQVTLPAAESLIPTDGPLRGQVRNRGGW
jgi:hypothetical protein